LNAIRSYIMGDFPVRIEARAQVSLFAYDNGTFIVESFRDQPADVRIRVSARRDSHKSGKRRPSRATCRR
jgi:hypothetical protein